MSTDCFEKYFSSDTADKLSITIHLAGPSRLTEEQIAAARRSPSPAEKVLEFILESISNKFVALRITPPGERNDGNDVHLQKIRGVAEAVFSRGMRGEKDARGQYLFEVERDRGKQKRQVIVDISLADIQVRVNGAAPRHGQDGILQEVGEYVKHTQPQETAKTGAVNHYLTGKFAPACEEELLVFIDNSLIHGLNGVNYLGHPIPARDGRPCQLRIGKGIRKVKLTPGKYHFLANRTGVVVPAYDKDGKLRTIDVRESVQIGEVGLREGGHVAKKDADGRTSALEIEDATVDSVGRPFTVRTTGTVTVRETIYGEVLAGNLNAQMINADGKIVAAHDTIRAVGPVQNSILRAPNISVGKSGKQGTVINSTFHARRNFTAANIRFLGHCQVVLGSDLVCANDEVVCGEDLFANRQHLLTVERTLQGQVEELDRNINEDLLRLANKPENGEGTGYRATLDKITEGVQAFALCPPENDEQLLSELKGAIIDLGGVNSRAFSKLLVSRKQLLEEQRIEADRLAAISLPLAIELNGVDLNDGAQLAFHCWRDMVVITRVEDEIIVHRSNPEETLLRAAKDKFTLSAYFDYQTHKLICSDLR